MTEEKAKETLRSAMRCAEKAWREYHVDRNVSSWELAERMEEEETLKATLGDGLLYIDLAFNPIFKRPRVRVTWWENARSWAIIVMRYDEDGWDIHVECQGGESECERMCFEIVKEANDEED